MLTLTLDGIEWFDNREDKYVRIPVTTVKLEHSLISLSRWEALWEVPFIPNSPEDTKTAIQLLSYIECMIIGTVSDSIVSAVSQKFGKDIEDYIAAPYSATKIYRPESKHKAKEPVTAEAIYYWMVKYGIPTEFNKWHLNRLLTLIDYFNVKDNPKKLTRKEIFERNRYLNAQRLATQKEAADAKA